MTAHAQGEGNNPDAPWGSAAPQETVGSPWGIPVPQDYTEQYTVFYEKVVLEDDALLIPSMLGWTDKTRAVEFLDYVNEQDGLRYGPGEQKPGDPILIHRTGEDTWERVE